MINKNFLWNMVGTTLNSFLSLFLLIIVTRVNGIEMSGSFSFIFTLTLILQMFSNYGGRIYQVSDYKNEFLFQEYFGSRVKTSLLSIIFFVIICFFYKFDLTLSIVAVSLMGLRLIETFSDIFYASFQKNNRLDKVGISLTIKSILILIIFLVVDVTSKNIKYASIGLLFAAFLTFQFYDYPNIIKYEKCKLKFNNDIYSKSKYIFLFGIISMLLINVGRLVGMNILNEKDIGYMGILMMIPTVMNLITNFIIQPEIMNLTNYFKYKDILLLKNKTLNLIKLLFAFSFLLILIAVSLGPLVFGFLYILDFNNFRFDFAILITNGLFSGVSAIYSNVLTIMRNTKVQLFIYMFMCALNYFLSSFLGTLFGLRGIFMALTLTMLVQTILLFIKYKKELLKFNK